MILEKGTFMGKRILSEVAITQMQTIQTNEKISKKYVPKLVAGFEYGLGEWIEASDSKGSTVVSSPGLLGTWPFIDKCRNYACIIFVKSIADEEKKDIYVQIKKAIDKQMAGSCN
jgi:hypothetical protein